MKKVLLIMVCLLTLLCGCHTKEQNNVNQTESKTVTFLNGVTDADVWLLPDTPANRKTTVWGKATLPQVKTGESRALALCDPGDDGRYLLRMIDTDGFYYAANGVALAAGWTVQVKEDDAHAVTATVTDETGAVKDTYEVFSAKL